MEKNGKSDISKPTAAKVEKVSIWEILENYLNTINQMVIGAITIYLSWFCVTQVPDAKRSLHVWLCMIGFQLLMAEAIMCFYYANSWSRLHSRRTKANIHWILQLVGSILAFIGCALEYSHHKREHFSTWHGITGLVSMIFCILAMINGIAALWSTELRQYIRPVYSKLFHTFCGAVGFVIGMLSIFYSYNTTTISNKASEDARYLLQIGAIITAVLSLLGMFRSWYGQIGGLLKR